MKTNKVIGYLLVIVGLAMIIYPSFNVYQVFKGKVKAFDLFSFAPIAIDLSKFVPQAPSNIDLKQDLIASDLLNKPLNLTFHLLLMGFVVSSGYKIASVGVMLVRTIKVKVKEEKSVLFPSR